MMDKDIVPELLEEVRKEFEQLYGSSAVVKQAFETLKKQKATYQTVNEYAIEIGDILSKALTGSVSSSRLPDGKMYYNIANRLLADTLGRNFELVSDYAGQVQEDLNKAAKIGLQVQVPEINQDRIDGLVNRLSFEDSFDDVAWILGEPIVNYTQSIVDDSIQVNADFHAKAGLTPTISRQSTGRCCKWCDSLVGNYIYGEEPPNFYRRHQHCRCTIDYHPKNGKRQNSWSKKWTKESQDKREIRKQMNIDVRDNNRKVDIQEYKKIVDVIGYQNSPISLAKFQDLKYNDVERYRELKDRVIWSESKFPTDKSIKGHFKSHGNEFGDITSEQYQKLAASLLAEPKSEAILGYETEHRRVRYDIENNIYALGNPKTGKITTMFKPKVGKEYFDGEFSKDMGD